MTNTPSTIASDEQVKELAMQTVKPQLSPAYEYEATMKDKGDTWEVVILPQARVRGGGARVTVAKQPLKVLKVEFLQ